METLYYLCLACATLKSLSLNLPSSLISTFSNSTIQLLIQTCICAKCSQNPYCYCLLCNSELNIYGKVHTSQTTLRKHINLHFLQKRTINCGFFVAHTVWIFSVSRSRWRKSSEDSQHWNGFAVRIYQL